MAEAMTGRDRWQGLALAVCCDSVGCKNKSHPKYFEWLHEESFCLYNQLS